MTIPIVSINDLIARVGGYGTRNPAFDAEFFDNIVKSATELIQNFCGRSFQYQVGKIEYFSTKKNYSVEHDLIGSSSNVITSGAYLQSATSYSYLSLYPVLEANIEVRYDTSRVFGDDTILVSGQDYIFDEDGQKLYLMMATGTCLRSLKVIYTGGYESNEAVDDADEKLEGLNRDLFMAGLMQAEYIYTKMQGKNLGYSYNMSPEGDKQVKFANYYVLLNEVMQMVSKYKKPKILFRTI